ncbi:hypothetical protein P869_06500 [Ligilactobacillus ruminis S23]|nr:hypothetical protein P869_06500 [Ligilactobacillus ruminis S23]
MELYSKKARLYPNRTMKKVLDGNMKHKTKHNEYVCYECGAVMNRDENAVMNLLVLI